MGKKCFFSQNHDYQMYSNVSMANLTKDVTALTKASQLKPSCVGESICSGEELFPQ